MVLDAIPTAPDGQIIIIKENNFLDIFDESDRSVWILGKGKSEKVRVQMNRSTVEAVKEWLEVRSNWESKSDALFICIGGTNRGAMKFVYSRQKTLTPNSSIQYKNCTS